MAAPHPASSLTGRQGWTAGASAHHDSATIPFRNLPPSRFRSPDFSRKPLPWNFRLGRLKSRLESKLLPPGQLQGSRWKASFEGGFPRLNHRRELPGRTTGSVIILFGQENMQVRKAINSDFETVAKFSRDFRFVAGTAVAAPVILISTFWLIPLLRKFGLEWAFFKWACIGTSLFAFVGLIAWAYELKFSLRSRTWIWPVLFVLESSAASAYYLFGQFYWAFERGFFLD